MSELPLIIAIQHDCLRRDINISDTLRKAKVATVKLEISEFQRWIDNELDGYGYKSDELPNYRKLSGQLKALNPYHGWQPVIFDDSQTSKMLSRAYIGQSIGPMEITLSEKTPNSVLAFDLPADVKARIIRNLEYATDVMLEISRGQLLTIVETVRNILLNWTLEMEKAGILGADMMFKREQIKEAVQVTQHFYNSNIAVAGNAQDNSTIKAIQTNYDSSLDLSAVDNLIRQAQDALYRLPDSIRSQASIKLADVKVEATKSKPDESRIRSILLSLKAVCEGALGNLTAEGIATMIAKLLV